VKAALTPGPLSQEKRGVRHQRFSIRRDHREHQCGWRSR
jgi:hypothetical protein